MPNWCYNKLRIAGAKEQLEKFRDKARGVGPSYKPYNGEKLEDYDAIENELNFHSLVPVPAELQAKEYAQYKLRPDYEGPAQCGFDWEFEHWGCKWGACEVNVQWEGDDLVYDFDTPWAPPIPFLMAASRWFRGLSMFLNYSERTMGFKGVAAFERGQLVHYHEEKWDAFEDPEQGD